MSKHPKKSASTPAGSKKSTITHTQKTSKPTSSKTQLNAPQTSINITATSALLNEKLNEVRLRLKKSFSAEFIESIVYFIQFEQQKQCNLESTFKCAQWSKLNYFLQQLKKICKQKQHLFLVFQKLQISSPKVSVISKKSEKFDDDRIELKVEMDDCSSSGDYFSLIRIMIRLLIKLIKFNCYGEEKRSQVVHDPREIFKLELTVLSCLADMCFYEEVRMQV